jgi:hypothetical protein
MSAERHVQDEPTTLGDPSTLEPGPTQAERRAFNLLPLVWIAVFVLAGIILYAVFS